MGEAARRMALSQTLERNCERILELYDEVVRTRSYGQRSMGAAA